MVCRLCARASPSSKRVLLMTAAAELGVMMHDDDDEMERQMCTAKQSQARQGWTRGHRQRDEALLVLLPVFVCVGVV